MSKKMKGVALYSSSYGHVDVAKARFKHQTLIQDYQELKKEADAMKNKLETMKLRKLTLSAEVRFLRQRYQYLSKNKAAKPRHGHELVQKQNFQTQCKKTTNKKNCSRQDAELRKVAPITHVNKKEKIFGAKEYARRNPSPVLELCKKDRIHGGKETSLRYRTPAADDLNQKENIPGVKKYARRNPCPVLELGKKDRIHGGKETSLRYRTPAAADLNQKERAYGGKQAALRNPTPDLDLNKRERLYSGKETTPRDPPPTFDLNQTERTYIGRENVAQIRAPVFDLNQISGEEEESHDIYEPLSVEKSTKKSIGGGTDEQLNDLSVCRNLGNGTNRVGKRKISWQDQVALKV